MMIMIMMMNMTIKTSYIWKKMTIFMPMKLFIKLIIMMITMMMMLMLMIMLMIE